MGLRCTLVLPHQCVNTLSSYNWLSLDPTPRHAGRGVIRLAACSNTFGRIRNRVIPSGSLFVYLSNHAAAGRTCQRGWTRARGMRVGQ